MRKTLNKVKVEGLLYENGLEVKTVENAESANFGQRYIKGKLEIQTQAGNVVPVTFWENERTKAGAANQKFQTLLNLMSNSKTVMTDGEDAATALSISGSQIGLNEWVKEDGSLVSTAQNSGGFVNYIDRAKLKPVASFELDVVVSNCFRPIDAATGDEKGYLTVQASAFDFRGSILPMTFSVFNPKGVEFFENLEPNTFIKVWGNQISAVVVSQNITENAFGEPLVQEVTRTTKHYEISGCNTIPYSEDDLTVSEFNEKCKLREAYIADLRMRDAARRTARSNQVNTAPAAPTPGFGAAPATPGFGAGFGAANSGSPFSF